MTTSLTTVAPLTIAGFGALGAAATLTEPMRRVALRYGLTDRPAAHKAHARTTPYLGGVAVVVATLLPAALAVRQWNPLLITMIAAALGIAGLGLLDDVNPLRPKLRLLIELVAA